MKEEIKKEIEQILKELGVESPSVVLEYPTRMDFGDLSTNVAMAYAKQLGKKPMDLAQQITKTLHLEALPPSAFSIAFITGSACKTIPGPPLYGFWSTRFHLSFVKSRGL